MEPDLGKIRHDDVEGSNELGRLIPTSLGAFNKMIVRVFMK